jgi:hypothetical protein
MLAIKFVELAVIPGMVLRSIPPVPIAALGDEQFFERKLALRLRRAGCSFGVEVPGVVEIIPGSVVLGSADPHIKIGIDPGAGN